VGQRARYRPQRLAKKLRQIRQSLGLSQTQLAKALNLELSCARLSEYESGAREPSLLTLLAYAYLIGIHVDNLIDDSLELPARMRIKHNRKQITLPVPVSRFDNWLISF